MDERPADLVLEGGGVKGIGLVGAVSALHDKGYRFGEPARVAGTSVGAIVGSLIAARMPVDQMATVMRELDFRQFRDGGHFGLLSRGWSLLRHMSLYRGDALHQWITEQLAACDVHTFADLRLEDPDSALPESQAYKLVLVVSDVTSGHMVRLPWDFHHYGLKADEQSVADAVRASASIPFYFRPVELPYEKGVAVLTDGGMLSNFPVNIFDRRDDIKPRWPTFGVKLSGKPPSGVWNPGWSPVHGALSLGKALVRTMASAHDRLYLDEPSVNVRTVFVDTNNTSATDFGLDDDKKQCLFDKGYVGAEKFYADPDVQDYLKRFR